MCLGPDDHCCAHVEQQQQQWPFSGDGVAALSGGVVFVLALWWHERQGQQLCVVVHSTV